MIGMPSPHLESVARPPPAPAPLPPAVLLGGGNIAVSAARALGERGATVVALGDSPDLVRYSRHCRRFLDLGAGDGVQDRWLAWLRAAAPGGAVIVPCSDDALELLIESGEELRERGLRPIALAPDPVRTVLDKARTYELAAAAGVPHPRWVAAAGEVDAHATGIGFPCAVKPLHSHLFRRHYGGMLKVLEAADQDQLDAALGRLRLTGVDGMVTEIVPGPDDSFTSYYTYVDDAGRPLIDVTKRKLRQWPVRFGYPCYEVSNRDQEVIDLGRRFVAAAGLRGLVNVEFKRDSRDGGLRLIECNARLTGASELVRASGVELAQLAYARAARLPDPPLDDYREGVWMWHPVEDVRALLAYRRDGELTARRWLRTLMHRQRFPILARDDLKPTIVRCWRLGRRAAELATGAAHTRRGAAG
jgi:D-aspartate ligase